MSHHRQALVLLLAVSLVRAALAQADAPPPDWPVELSPALAAYAEDDLGAARRLAGRVAERAGDADLRRNADALALLIQLREPARRDRLDARSQLMSLSAADPELLERPECLLALGAAQRRLNETASAITSLQLAVERFQVQQRAARADAAAVELAEAWAVHNEWEFPIPGVASVKPVGAVDAAAERLKHVRGVREGLSGGGGGDDAVAAIELIEANIELSIPATREAGAARLDRLSSGPLDRPWAVQARFRKARVLEELGRRDDAAAIYATMLGAPREPDALQARAALGVLREPSVALDAPRSALPQEPIRLAVQSRNVRSVALEVRRIDLPAMMSAGRGAPATEQLDSGGAVAFTGQLAAPADQSAWHGEFDACRLDPGAYVIVARGEAAARESVTRRLVVVSSLSASALVGENTLAIAVAPRHEAPATARFWIAGDATPLLLTLSAGAVVAPLPTSARLSRQRRWFCLVEQAGQMALLEGELSQSAASPRTVASAMTLGAPETVAPGEDWSLVGMLIEHGVIDRMAPTARVEVQMVDAADAVIRSESVLVDENRVFSAGFRFDAAHSGRTLRAIVRSNGVVLASSYQRAAVTIATRDASTPLAVVDGAAHLAEVRPVIPTEIRAAMSNGRPLRDAQFRSREEAIRLPATDMSEPFAYSPPRERRNRLDADGRRQTFIPVSEFGLPPGPIALAQRATIRGWDDRPARVDYLALLGAPEPHLWIMLDGPEDGRPLRVGAGWFDPSRLAGGATPIARIVGVPGDAVELPLLPGASGYWSDPWFAPHPGAFDVVVSLALRDGSTLERRRTIEIASGSGEAPTHQVTAVRAGAAVRVRGRIDGELPMLALLACGDPADAAWVGPGEFECELLPPRGAIGRREVFLVDPARGGRAAANVIVRDESAGELRFSEPLLSAVQGAPFAAQLDAASVARPESAMTRIVCIRDTDGVGTLNWFGAPTTAPERNSRTISLHTSAGSGDPRPLPVCEPIDPGIVASLTSGRAVAVESQRWSPRGGGAARIDRIDSLAPRTAGEFRATTLIQCDAAGVTAAATTRLSVLQPIRLALDAPSTLVRGDRCTAALRAENATDEPVVADVRIDAGGLLADFDVSVLRGAARYDATSGKLDLPPHSTALLSVRFEASRAGDAVLRATVRASPTRAASAAKPIRVLGAPASQTSSAPASDVRVLRELFKLVSSADDAAAGPGAVPRGVDALERVPLGDDERVACGTLLLVVETFDVPAEARDVAWSQDVPAVGVTFGGDTSKLKALGKPRVPDASRWEWSLDVLRSGRFQHEYIVTATRPGYAALPAPEIRAAGRSLVVELTDPRRIAVGD